MGMSAIVKTHTKVDFEVVLRKLLLKNEAGFFAVGLCRDFAANYDW